MSRADLTTRQKSLAVVIGLAAMALLVAIGLLLREHAPGNMGLGFLQGAGVALLGLAVVAWRVSRQRATTFERAWTQTGDERDDAVLTRALAVLGLLSFPLTGVAAIAVGLGAEVFMVVALLLVGQAVVLAASFWVINRQS
jgi:hypothetical protein